MSIIDRVQERQKAVSIASDVIEGEISLLEGCKKLASLSDSLTNDWIEDEDFVVFCAISSEADTLPTGSDRQYWSNEALFREDEKIAVYESKVKNQILKACESIVQRFRDLQ